jgi:hypothetical protein
MSGVAVIRFLLANAVADLVPAKYVMGGVIPVGTPLPALSVQEISSVPRTTVAMNSPKMLLTERVQVTVEAKSYPEQKTILARVRAACPNQHGMVNGVDLDSILPDVGGPDLFDAETAIYMQTQDFIVKYRA